MGFAGYSMNASGGDALHQKYNRPLVESDAAFVMSIMHIFLTGCLRARTYQHLPLGRILFVETRRFHTQTNI